MDFSSVDPSYLPEALQENPNIRDYVRNYVNDSLEEYEVDGILERAGITIDTDELCNEVLQSAAYEITDVQTSYNRCTVFVHTENTDFSQAEDGLKQAASAVEQAQQGLETLRQQQEALAQKKAAATNRAHAVVV